MVDVVEKNVLSFGNAIFDIAALNDTISGWFGSHKYVTPKRSPKQKVRPLGVEYEFSYKAMRTVDRHARYVIEVAIQTLYTQDVNVTGTDKVLQQGDVSVSIKSKIELDPDKTLSKSYFQKFLKYIYENYIYVPKIIRHKVQLGSETGSLQSAIKSVLKQYN